jgi:hypothetical protein
MIGGIREKLRNILMLFTTIVDITFVGGRVHLLVKHMGIFLVRVQWIDPSKRQPERGLGL